MPEIGANQIKELREKTGAGVLDCKKALVESSGDIEKAVEILRKTGAAKAEKKSGRITAEGRVVIAMEGKKAALVEVNCETDFVAKNPDFDQFAQAISQQILKTSPTDVNTLLDSSYQGRPLRETLQALVLKIGENISIRRFSVIQATEGEEIGSYIHMGNKIGVLVVMQGPSEALTDSMLKDISMHVAAASPQFLSRDQIPSDLIEREKQIYKEQMKDLQKPVPVLEKILEGKLSRFEDEICLLNQIFVKDPSGKQSVSDYVKSIHPKAGIKEFLRYQVGEGIAKKEESFAAEVAKQLNP